MGGNLGGGLVENGWDERGVGEVLFVIWKVINM